MKLLYATSISFPSQYANRLQILANSEQFGRILGTNFWLGANSLKGREFPFQKIEVGGPWKSPILAWKYLRFIRKNGITHVYTREDHLLFFLKKYATCTRTPLTFLFEAHTAKKGFFLNSAVKKADGVIAITNGIRADFIARGINAEKIIVAHDAADLSLFEIADSKQKLRSDFNIPVNAKVVAYVGKYTTMGKQKGVDELVAAFSEAYKKNSLLHLLIVGLSEAEMPLLKGVCEKAGLAQSSYTLVAHVPNSEVPKYMKASDMLVMNYPNTEHYAKYMSPMKLFEYMAARVPIITTDLPSVREVLNDSEAFYVPCGDIPALVSKMLEIAGHEKNASLKAEAAYKKVRNEYTWEKRVQGIMAQFGVRTSDPSFPKKILIVSHTLDVSNGWGRYTFDLRSELSRRGYAVSCTADPELITRSGGLSEPLAYLRSPLLLLRDIMRFRKIVKDMHPDIIHITIEPYMLLLPFFRWGKEKIIVTMHGTYAYFVGFAPAVARGVYKRVFARALVRVHDIIAISAFTQAYFLRRIGEEGISLGGARIHMIHNGIRVADYPYRAQVVAAQRKPKRIICIGAVKPRKGLVEALHVLAEYKKQFGGNFTYRWGGSYKDDHPYVVRAKKLIETLGLKDNVELLGRIREETLKAEYAAADVFMLLPVVIDGTQFEGFGLVYLEANACGIPAIAARGSGSAEAVEDGVSGYVVDPRDAKAAAAKLNAALNGSISRSAARAWAERHDISHVVGEVVSVYNS